MTRTGSPRAWARRTAAAGSATASTTREVAPARARRARRRRASARSTTASRRSGCRPRRGGAASRRRPCPRGSRRRRCSRPPAGARAARRCRRGCGRRHGSRLAAARAGRGGRRRPSRSIAWPTNASAASRAPPSDDPPAGTSGAKRVVRQDHYRVVSMDNSELLRRDLLDRLAEDVGVLEPDVRQQDDPGAEDVRRVVAAAEAGLDDGDVDLRVGERGQRGSGDRLELRRADLLRRRPDARAAPPRGRPGGRRAGSARPTSARAARSSSRRRALRASSSCSIVTVAVDFPFVPTTWTAG